MTVATGHYNNIIRRLQVQGFTLPTIANSIGISYATLDAFLTGSLDTLPAAAKNLLLFYAAHQFTDKSKKRTAEDKIALTPDMIYVTNCLISENLLAEHVEADATPQNVQTLASIITVMELKTHLNTLDSVQQRQQLTQTIAKLTADVVL